MQHFDKNKVDKLLKTLGKVVRKTRNEQKVSQRVLLGSYEKYSSLISRMENGKNTPWFTSVWAVAEMLGMKPSELLSKIEAKLPDDFTLVD